MLGSMACCTWYWYNMRTSCPSQAGLTPGEVLPADWKERDQLGAIECLMESTRGKLRYLAAHVLGGQIAVADTCARMAEREIQCLTTLSIALGKVVADEAPPPGQYEQTVVHLRFWK